MLVAPGQVSHQAEEDEVDQVQVERPDWLKKKEKFQAMAQELKEHLKKFVILFSAGSWCTTCTPTCGT